MLVESESSYVVLSCEPVKGIVWSSEAVGLQAGGPGPWLGGHWQSNTGFCRGLMSAVRKLQRREDCSQLATR
jgi:hypothetical protein